MQDISPALEARKAGPQEKGPTPFRTARDSDKSPATRSPPEGQALRSHTAAVCPAGSKWLVRLVPPVPGDDLDRVFPDIEAACDYAYGLRREHGLWVDVLNRLSA